MKQTILIGKGLENLTFGLSKAEVKAALGEPSEIERFAFGSEEDENTEAWHYDELEISLSFDEDEDWTLTGITTSNTASTLDNVELMGLSKEALETALKNFDFGEIIEEEIEGDESEPPMELLTYPEVNLMFWFDEDQVSEIQWGPLIDEEGDFVWPENESN